MRFVAALYNPTNQSTGAWRPLVNCRPPRLREEGSVKPKAGHPPAKMVGFDWPQTAAREKMFSIRGNDRQAVVSSFFAKFASKCFFASKQLTQ